MAEAETIDDLVPAIVTPGLCGRKEAVLTVTTLGPDGSVVMDLDTLTTLVPGATDDEANI